MDRGIASVDELTIEELTSEAIKLLAIGLEELYVVLGCQLLGYSRPSRVAGIMRHQLALKKMIEATEMYEPLALKDVADWGRKFELMYDELKQDGARFLESARLNLQDALCTEEILAFSDNINSGNMQIIVLLIAAVLKMPPQIESVAATIAAILCKSGLRTFCK